MELARVPGKETVREEDSLASFRVLLYLSV